MSQPLSFFIPRSKQPPSAVRISLRSNFMIKRGHYGYLQQDNKQKWNLENQDLWSYHQTAVKDVFLQHIPHDAVSLLTGCLCLPIAFVVWPLLALMHRLSPLYFCITHFHHHFHSPKLACFLLVLECSCALGSSQKALFFPCLCYQTSVKPTHLGLDAMFIEDLSLPCTLASVPLTILLIHVAL